MLAVVCTACATAANRRELYNTSDSKSGTWHDYDRRRKAEQLTGISGGATPSVLPDTRGKATAAPTPGGTPGALPPGASVAVPQSPMTPDAAGGAPAPAAVPAPAPADVPPPVAPTGAPDAGGAVPVVPEPTPATQ